MKRIVTITLISILTMFSCSVDDTLTLPHQQPKLAITCVGQNENAWTASVTTSHDALENNDFSSEVPNATVAIYESGALKENLVYKGRDLARGSMYKGVYFPQPGKSYSISVSAPGYETAAATFLQPALVTPSDLKVTIIKSGSGETDLYDLFFDVTFTDPPGENFYELELMGVSDRVGNYSYGAFFGGQFVDPVYRENNELYPQSAIFADTFFNGTTTTLRFQALSTYWVDVERIAEYTVYLRSMSKEYYHYLRTVHLQQKNAKDPFAQPVLIENNITNGYGVFGGLTEGYKTVPAPK